MNKIKTLIESNLSPDRIAEGIVPNRSPRSSFGDIVVTIYFSHNKQGNNNKMLWDLVVGTFSNDVGSVLKDMVTTSSCCELIFSSDAPEEVLRWFRMGRGEFRDLKMELDRAATNYDYYIA